MMNHKEIDMPVQLTDTKGSLIPVTFLQFSGGERHVQIAASTLTTLTGQVYVQARMQSSNDVMDYLLLENVLLERGLCVNLEIPYFPYARQDRACAVGQAFSLDVMTRLLSINAGKKTGGTQGKLVVWDCHSNVTLALLAANTHFTEVINVSPADIIQNCPALVQMMTTENSILICPDHGALARTQLIADALNLSRDRAIPIIYCEKKRDPVTGKILNAQVNATDLSGLTALITDDICDGGATFIGIAQELRRLNCSKIMLYVTHGIFSRGLGVFEGLIDQIFTTDSFLNVQNLDHNLDQTNPQNNLQTNALLTTIAFSAN
jgi:ribose-phosphate pyrophosphokinase